MSHWGAVEATPQMFAVSELGDWLEQADALGLYNDPTVLAAKAVHTAWSNMSGGTVAVNELKAATARVSSLVNNAKAGLPTATGLDWWGGWIRLVDAVPLTLPRWGWLGAGIGLGVLVTSGVGLRLFRRKRRSRR